MRLKVAFCLALVTLPFVVGCSSEPKEEATPAPPPAAGAAGGGTAGAPQQGAKGIQPQ